MPVTLPHHLRSTHFQTLTCAEGLDDFPDFKEFAQLCARTLPAGFAFVWAKELVRADRMELLVTENERWEDGVQVKEDIHIFDSRQKWDETNTLRVAKWYAKNNIYQES